MSLRLIGVKAHSHFKCCQLFAKIYVSPKKMFLRRKRKNDDKIAVYLVTGSYSTARRAEREKAQR